MTDNEKIFIDDWAQYHGSGKWQFILFYGSILGSITYIVGALLKYFVFESVSWNSFKALFFTQKTLLELIASTLTIGVFLGYLVWKLSDSYFQKIIKNED